MAITQIPTDQKAETTISFLNAAVEFFAAHGSGVRAYPPFANNSAACAWLGGCVPGDRKGACSPDPLRDEGAQRIGHPRSWLADDG
jgi:hypothetical protein